MLKRIGDFLEHRGLRLKPGHALRFHNHPFIVKKIPFVCHEQANVLPFICINIPFVVYSKNDSGFTLLELIVTVVIAGILIALAAPTLTTFTANQRISGQANELLSDLTFARSEAIRRSSTVTVCKTTNPNVAAPACNATVATAWTAGRLVFVDVNGDGVIDAGDEVLRIRQELEGATSSQMQLSGDGNDPAGTAKRITFQANGATNLPVGAEYQLLLCDRRGDAEGRAVAIHPLGRSRVTEKGKNMDNSAITACP